MGLACGVAIIAVAIVLGGSPGSFVNLPGLLIVLGGTFAAVAVSSSVGDVGVAVRLVAEALFRPRRDPAVVALGMLNLAETARHKGLLSLEHMIDTIDDAPVLRKAMGLVIDGMRPAEVEGILARDLGSTAERHVMAVGVLRRAAEYAPAMGLIGTLIGLVQMLGKLDDPHAIGPSMAVALLTTLYGAVLANLVFSPLAAKLERNAADEGLLNRMYALGAVSIGRQENPRRLEMLLNSVLPPAKRVQHFD
ncbi:MAG: flagellar motor protein MotA [Rhodospirillales bacterium]|nr:MAG: flagellar motor protein MotA [Rhodospirillales bacterium]